jgi:hypothetical protein
MDAMEPMAPLLAAKADEILTEAFNRFVPVALAAIAFGIVYFLVRRRMEKRKKEKMQAWIAERRLQRGAAADREPPKPE